MNAKKKLFQAMDRIDELKSNLPNLTDKERNELDNLEVKKMQYWSEWKDFHYR